MAKKLYIETYGCQMNVADSEVVASILGDEGYICTGDISEADLILVNTCSIRENAEQKIWNRMRQLKSMKKKRPQLLVGLIGCMAERLKEQLVADGQSVDFVAGPDAYRELPRAVAEAGEGQKSVNTILSLEETYGDISPVRLDANGVSSFISIMRGCDNFCAYCVVPYVRGRERSRDPESIYREASELFGKGYREVTLLGQNVNSYRWKGSSGVMNFPDLLEKIAGIDPLLRVRFATSHPKDLSDHLIEVISRNRNICRHIHLPAQSGSNNILKLMNRKYTREQYLAKIEAIKRGIPDCSISTDIIAGFCTETEDDHKDTLALMEEVGYDFAYMFKYSERPGTKAAESMTDDVPEEIKIRRLNEIIALQNSLSERSKKGDVGRTHEVLTEGVSKRSAEHLTGRTSQNKVVVFPKSNISIGEYVKVTIERSTSATLIGKVSK
jgi:tRNA-2-methylthio-N6-dimethylallyladenosine synthase